MIFITAKFRTRATSTEAWPEIVRPFTAATRNEPGCLWFEWSRSIDDPAVYVLVEAFRDEDAGRDHVTSEHFARACRDLPQHLEETPRIVNVSLAQDDWSLLGEMTVGEAS